MAEQQPKRPTNKMVASILKDLDDELGWASPRRQERQWRVTGFTDGLNARECKYPDRSEQYRKNYEKGRRVAYWLRREGMPSDGQK